MTLSIPANLTPPSRYKAGSSEWWIEKLSRALHARQARLALLDDYYRGEQNLQQFASQAWLESELVTMFPDYLSANHSKLIVNAVAHRLVVLGFRLSTEAEADTEAARIWHANDMKGESDKAHTEALVKGECPILVEPNPDDPRTPIITPQDPAEVIVWNAPGDRRIRLAALKTWWDDVSRKRFYILYLPDRTETWQDRAPSQMDAWQNRLFGSEPAQWEPRNHPDQPWQQKNPLNEIPIIVLPNEPRLAGSPEGEHEPALNRIDQYNKTLMDMAVTSHELAYPQRYGTGIEADEGEPLVDEETGEPIATPPARARTGQTRWVTTASPEGKFGQFEAATIENYVRALDQIRGDIATDTFTPYHFLLNMPSSVPPSGESLSAAEVPLVDKTRGHARDKGIGWRHVMRLAFRIAGDERRATAMRETGYVIWEDPQRRTESQHIDALGKMVTMLGVPKRAAWELIPAPPEQMDRWDAMVLQEAAAAPPPPAVPAVSDPGTSLGGPAVDASIQPG